jgi:hypothetical protein
MLIMSFGRRNQEMFIGDNISPFKQTGIKKYKLTKSVTYFVFFITQLEKQGLFKQTMFYLEVFRRPCSVKPCCFYI